MLSSWTALAAQVMWNGGKYGFPATFCAPRYINDPNYLPGDKETSRSRQGTPRQAISMFRMTATPTPAQKFTDFRLISIVTTKTIRSNEKMFSSYVPE